MCWSGEAFLQEVTSHLEGGNGYLRLGAGHAGQLLNLLKAKTGKGRGLALQSQSSLGLPGKRGSRVSSDGWRSSRYFPDRGGPRRVISAFKAPHRNLPHGDNAVPLTIEIVPTHIRDNEGNVAETIGQRFYEHAVTAF